MLYPSVAADAWRVPPTVDSPPHARASVFRLIPRWALEVLVAAAADTAPQCCWDRCCVDGDALVVVAAASSSVVRAPRRILLLRGVVELLLRTRRGAMAGKRTT